MPTDESIDELMLRWEAARQAGRDMSAQELCADCPHMEGELQKRIRAVLSMEHFLGVTEHDPRRTMMSQEGHGHAAAPGEPLPRIPGYEILRIIDRGGMGVVYEARQIELGRTVAIKMISGAHVRPKHLARFRVEAEAAARLQHANFVQIFHVGEVNGRPFFSMEYVAGGSLADRLTRSPLAAREAAGLVETLARAVHAAHECGIVHRDLKPSNVMLADDGTPKIADFGLAKLLDDDSSHTHTGEILGTPSYMAPEQAEGNKDQIGPATDVYALGAILYELLAGKPPFQGTSPLDSLRLVMSQEPVPPSQLAAAVPRDLEAICLKCLEKTPAHRYATAQGLADDLRRFLNGQPVIARHIGPVQRGWKWVRRHPQGVALAATLGVLALIPIYFAVANYRTQREIRLRAEQQAPQVREILHRNCYECHGHDPRKIQKNLNILNYQQLLDGSRRIVVPGAPKESRLIQRIDDGSMPPEEEETRLPRLTDRELTILTDWILGGAPPLPAADADEIALSAPAYSESAAKVKKIFQDNCYECHQYKAAKGGIKILHHRLLVTVRKVVIPGDPDNSELYKLLTKGEMPPPEYGPLTPQEIDTVRQWIAEGAAPFPKEK
jgi:mono/diheme cytochrome c family protein